MALPGGAFWQWALILTTLRLRAAQHLPDTRLQERAVDVRAAIKKAVREFKPDLVLTHSPHDMHQDHRTVHEATLRAASNSSTILCYESPSVTQEFAPTFFSNIGDYLDIKVEGIKEHWDQRSKPYCKRNGCKEPPFSVAARPSSAMPKVLK